MTDTHPLSPFDVMALRTSLRVRPSDGTFALALRPHQTLNAEGLWELHAYGRLQALHPDGAIIMACIAREHWEPGFIADLMNPALDCEVVLRPLDTKRAYAASVQAFNDRLRAEREAAEESAYRARRAAAFEPANLSLSDLD